MRNYKCLDIIEFREGNYSLLPIRDEDKYNILNWRNEQISILRQQAPISKEEQETYYRNVIDKLFEVDYPNQILWSVFENEKLIGYGGLVHIDWKNMTAEISFLTETSRNNSKETFISDWCNYLTIIKHIAQSQLHFIRIYTYAYDIRPNLYIALENSGFIETERFKNFIEINGEKKDVVIHSFFLSDLNMRMATSSDAELYYKWANDQIVRNNSFSSSEIGYEQHINWFNNKLKSKECYFYLFLTKENNPVGQVRIDKANDEIVIGISVDANFRGKNFSSSMLRMACDSYLFEHPDAVINAYIKENNIASVKTFIKAGFQEKDKLVVSNNLSYRLTKSKK